jgi:GTP diphosphokinase / guanosine-3',5'-bis(diphosphate) 3'-diphosphatase
MINGERKSLLSELKNGDSVRILTSDEIQYHCSWSHSVKTSRAKSSIKTLCKQKLKEINYKSNINIIASLFFHEHSTIDAMIASDKSLSEKLTKDVYTIEDLRELKAIIKEKLTKDKSFFSKLKLIMIKLRPKKIDNVNVYCSSSISNISYDYCCHPKFGDEIVAFKEKSTAIIHHKFCDKALKKIQNQDEMLFVEWDNSTYNKYKMIVSLENKKGSIAAYLNYLAKYDINVSKLIIGDNKNNYFDYCEFEIESDIADINKLKGLLAKRSRVIEIYKTKDAYNN